MARRRPGSANQLQRVVRAYAREYGLYEEFSFRRAREPHVMPSGAIRVEVAVQYAGGVWGRVVLDLNRHEGHEEIELVDALDLGALFGVTEPSTVPVLGLPWHVAHKIHAVSLPSTPDRPNDRVQDATWLPS